MLWIVEVLTHRSHETVPYRECRHGLDVLRTIGAGHYFERRAPRGNEIGEHLPPRSGRPGVARGMGQRPPPARGADPAHHGIERRPFGRDIDGLAGSQILPKRLIGTLD